MPGESKTVIVTGASQGIGAGVVTAFLEKGYRVVANSRSITRTGPFTPSDTARSGRRGHRRGRDGREDRRDRRRSIRVDRRARQQRGHLLHEGVHRLHGRGFQVARLDEPRRASFTSPSSRSSRCWPRSPGAAS